MNLGFEVDPCAKCEEQLQPYLDRELTDAERLEAEGHLDNCSYCRKRYRFEEELRRFVRQAAVEEMPPALKQKLADLRTPLYNRKRSGSTGWPRRRSSKCRCVPEHEPVQPAVPIRWPASISSPTWTRHPARCAYRAV